MMPAGIYMVIQELSLSRAPDRPFVFFLLLQMLFPFPMGEALCDNREFFYGHNAVSTTGVVQRLEVSR